MARPGKRKTPTEEEDEEDLTVVLRNKKVMCKYMKELIADPTLEKMGLVLAAVARKPELAIDPLDAHGRTLVWMAVQAVADELTRDNLLYPLLSLPSVNLNGRCDNGYLPLMSLSKQRERARAKANEQLGEIIDQVGARMTSLGAQLGEKATEKAIEWSNSLSMVNGDREDDGSDVENEQDENDGSHEEFKENGRSEEVSDEIDNHDANSEHSHPV